ncbi:MAG: protein kinase [Polyangiaceae bacterium]
MACPDENTFAAFVDGDLPAEERASVVQHVDTCESCRSVLSDLARLRSGVSRVAEASGVTSVEPEASAVGPRHSHDEPDAAGARESGGRAEGAPASGGAPAEFAGRYQIESTLGRGGMGVVYRAWDPVLARRVALKRIRPDRADESAGDRMLREARAMAAISHPNVVQVYDAGVVERDVWIAMELVEGEPLSALLARDRLEPRAVMKLFREAARGLERAHAAGILHRDFKPSNVFVSSSGAVKVGDFGLSRVDRALASRTPPNPFDQAPATSEPAETRAGTILGTLQYMAPEQMLGHAVDARADQFSFAVALYHALFGEFPFRGATIEELRAAFVWRSARAPEELRGAPPSWMPILLRALAVHPEERFATMSDFLSALDAADDEAHAGHLRVHVYCQIAFGVCHLIATVVFAVGMSGGGLNPGPSPPDEPGEPGGSLLAGMLTVIGLLLWIGFIVFGTIWAPLNAWGLSKRYPWARTSTLAYAALGAFTCIGVPYAIYAAWSLTRPAVRWAFAKPERR